MPERTITSTRASIRQVAQLARVSPMTVTRVLRGNGTVAEDTRQRVLEAVRQTDYVPIPSAVQNRHSPTSILGFVPASVEGIANRLDIETYAGIVPAAQRHGYDLLVLLRGESEWMTERAAARFLDRRTDGFVFLTAGRGEWQGVLETLGERDVPVVVCYRRDVPEGVVWVDPDNETIMRHTVGTLIRSGHRKIAYLTGPSHVGNAASRLAWQQQEGNFDDRMRRASFERAVGEAGVAATILETPRVDWILEDALLDAIFASGVSGVVCVNDVLALQLWRLVEARGLRVPHDLSITGVDDLPAAKERGLTTVGFGYDLVGEAAVEAWVQRVRGEDADRCHRVVPVAARDRISVAAPRKS